MKPISKFTLRLIALLAVLMLGVNGILAQGEAMVRFVHVVADTAAIDVYVNGTLAVVGLDNGAASDYLGLQAGTYTITATPAGSTDPLWEQSVTLDTGTAKTLIASSGSSFDAFSDNLSSTAFGSSRLLLVHAIAGGDAVDVTLAEPVTLNGVEQAAGTTIASGLAYASSFGAFDLPAQTYVVNVSEILENVSLPLNSGTSYIAVVHGTVDNPAVLLLSAPTVAPEDTGLVRFVHGVFGADAVDVYVNGTLVVPMLGTNNPSAHIAVLAGDAEVSYVVAGGEDEVANTSITVEAGAAQTVAALASGDEVSLSSFADDLSGISSNDAVVTVLNTIDGSTVTLSLNDGTELSSELEAGEASDASVIAPITSEVAFDLAMGESSGNLTSPEVTFYAGTYYNVIVLGGDAFNPPNLVIASTAIDQGLGSAPNSEVAINVGQSQEPAAVATTETPSEVVAATPAPVVELPQNVITGQVALDPSANLQLRQYPNPDALSLGLAPSGALLVINGREGRPVALVEGQAEPAEAADWVDPVELLGEGEDLDPAQTWLNVTFNTADGGQITAWVLSQFLIIRDDAGDLVPLRELDTFPRNVAGDTVNTNVTPPTAPENLVVAIVININSDANLNLRRTPTTDGEILARLSLGTVVELVGFIAPSDINTPFIASEAEWAFVSYSPAEGGVITGWASTGFLRYEWRDATADPDELFARELVEIIDPTIRGEVSEGAPAVSAPTQDPIEDAYVATVVLNEGANIHLRRNPDVSSESLVLIPAGTLLIVDVRTAQADWLHTSFEGEEGWISSQFVTITYNGRFVEDITEIPVDVSSVPLPLPTATTAGS
jgi:uncharacterized protein YgiM (DUF1202 family)